MPRQHFTQPPPRYTEATLVKALEENGIGRPSTYASILSTIVDRNYTSVDQRRFTPTDLGFLVNDKLVQHFGNIVDVHFTAGIEEKLDDVEEGKRGWTAVLRDFYDPFHAGVVLAGTEMEKVGPEETDLPCLKCATLLQRKRGRFGSFYSCPNEECKATFNIGNEGEVVAKTEKVELHIEGTDPDEKRVCEKCNSKMTIRMSARGPFWGCTGYPKCRNVVAITDSVIVDSNGEKVEYSAKPAAELTDFDCPVCGKKLNKRAGRFGPFLGCSDYPTCKTIVNLDKEGNPRWPAPGEAKQMGAKKSAKPAAKSATKTAAKPATKTAAKTTATAKTTKITAKAVTSQADLDALLSAPTKPVAKMAAPKATAREKTAV